jgi:hypothetical protein
VISGPDSLATDGSGTQKQPERRLPDIALHTTRGAELDSRAQSLGAQSPRRRGIGGKSTMTRSGWGKNRTRHAAPTVAIGEWVRKMIAAVDEIVGPRGEDEINLIRNLSSAPSDQRGGRCALARRTPACSRFAAPRSHPGVSPQTNARTAPRIFDYSAAPAGARPLETLE